MSDVSEILKVAAGFVCVTTLTILADRFFSNKVAIAVLVVSAVVLCILNWNWLKEKTHSGQQHRVVAISICVVVFAGIGALVGVILTRPQAVHDQNGTDNRSPTTTEKPPTLADLFETDFPNVFKGADEAVLDSKTDGTVLHIKRHVYMDFAAKTQFVAFYIPYLPSNHGNQAFDASMALVDVVQPTLDKLDNHVSAGGDVGGINSAQELVFSGRVFLYHEQPLSNLQKAKIVETYHARNYDVNFRGLDYLAMQSGR